MDHGRSAQGKREPSLRINLIIQRHCRLVEEHYQSITGIGTKLVFASKYIIVDLERKELKSEVGKENPKGTSVVECFEVDRDEIEVMEIQKETSTDGGGAML